MGFAAFPFPSDQATKTTCPPVPFPATRFIPFEVFPHRQPYRVTTAFALLSFHALRATDASDLRRSGGSLQWALTTEAARLASRVQVPASRHESTTRSRGAAPSAAEATLDALSGLRLTSRGTHSDVGTSLERPHPGRPLAEAADRPRRRSGPAVLHGPPVARRTTHTEEPHAANFRALLHRRVRRARPPFPATNARSFHGLCFLSRVLPPSALGSFADPGADPLRSALGTRATATRLRRAEKPRAAAVLPVRTTVPKHRGTREWSATTSRGRILRPSSRADATIRRPQHARPTTSKRSAGIPGHDRRLRHRPPRARPRRDLPAMHRVIDAVRLDDPFFPHCAQCPSASAHVRPQPHLPQRAPPVPDPERPGQNSHARSMRPRCVRPRLVRTPHRTGHSICARPHPASPRRDPHDAPRASGIPSQASRGLPPSPRRPEGPLGAGFCHVPPAPPVRV